MSDSGSPITGSPNVGDGSPITGVNLGVRSWASDPRKPSSGVQIEKDTLSNLFGVSRWGHVSAGLTTPR